LLRDICRQIACLPAATGLYRAPLIFTDLTHAQKNDS
jgi:hypothetical protein